MQDLKFQSGREVAKKWKTVEDVHNLHKKLFKGKIYKKVLKA